MKHQNTVIITVMSALAFALAPVTNAGQTLRVAHVDPICSGRTTGYHYPRTDNVTRGKTGSFVLVRGLGNTREDTRFSLMSVQRT